MCKENEFKCLMCNRSSPTTLNDTYRGGVCIHCGQKYQYEEGWQIVLTEKQMEALRDLMFNPQDRGGAQ